MVSVKGKRLKKISKLHFLHENITITGTLKHLLQNFANENCLEN